jgi:hypothetical protein
MKEWTGTNKKFKNNHQGPILGFGLGHVFEKNDKKS